MKISDFCLILEFTLPRHFGLNLKEKIGR